MKQDTSNRGKAIVGTMFLHAAILFLLLTVGFTTPLPLPEEQGVEVNLGFSDQGLGDNMSVLPAGNPTPTPPPSSSQKSEVVTADDDESVALPDKKTNKKNNEEAVVKNTVKQNVPETPKVDPNALYTGKTKQTGGQNQGVAGGFGNQGKPDGNPASNNYEGGGKGNGGINFSLSGRGKVYLNEPPYDSPEQGRVVVEIIVDRKGNVIRATAGKKIPNTTVGTTTTDSQLWKVAKDAALHSKFTADPNAPEEQKGYITYNFIRVN